jgi:hypothetical protein
MLTSYTRNAKLKIKAPRKPRLPVNDGKPRQIKPVLLVPKLLKILKNIKCKKIWTLS